MSDWYKKRWQAQRAAVKAAKAALKEEKRLRQIDKETIETLRSANGHLEVMSAVGASCLDAVEAIMVARAYPPPRDGT